MQKKHCIQLQKPHKFWTVSYLLLGKFSTMIVLKNLVVQTPSDFFKKFPSDTGLLN